MRPLRMEDRDAVAETLGDFQVARMLADVPVPFDREDATVFLVRQTCGVLAGWSFAVTGGGDAALGAVMIGQRRGRWELAFWLNRYFWGRGYAAEAVHAVAERFFRRMPEAELYAGAFADNPAALKIQRRIGLAIVDCGEVYCAARGAMVSHIAMRATAEMLSRP
ncbi:GNAT family N-acetyltransferase [Ensifer soli]|uniref:GNAT family N-acetyltransferase n=1 Tax=Ciceribacter sp. sgz301302 TaxID=3342379 RepID=UPI0035BB11A0